MINRNKQQSFTLIELLVVIVIIGILAGVIMISTSSSIDKANLTRINSFSESIKNRFMINLVGNWKLDEGSGTNILDSWNSNNGTLSETAIWQTGTNCISGSCLRFPATGMITIPHSNNFSNLNELTVEMWVKIFSQDQEWEEFFVKDPENDRIETATIGGRGLWINGTNYNNLYNYAEWFHLVYSSSATLTQTSLYINGKPIVEKANFSRLPYGTGNIKFGTCYSTQSFDGALDEIKIYDKYISADEASAIYLSWIK
ncbi:MAG TPA: prepilin-type N-terminal cleavage/methylation domain-containing protein [Candidatus Pacearchaeota archaeon]|nr:prepilin-type N-terminal cleavage/methylation domain-containing protein [Candidatus Pacearchaeota archaeon]